MPPNIDFDAILALPPADRMALAEAIWESVGADGAAVSEELWAELKARIDRYDADPSSGVPWEEIDADARAGDEA
jgi:putative addiction module component (TIGR02574 family)